MPTQLVYNFEFPRFRMQFKVAGYRFERVPEYEERVKALHHTMHVHHEFDIPLNSGGHAITATVEAPRHPSASVIPWGHSAPTALDDILLLFSLFTGRQVFALRRPLTTREVLTADPRKFFFGTSLRKTLRYKPHREGDSEPYDVGFEEGIEKVYSTIKQESWLKTYGEGYFLLIFREACRRQILESSFMLCWSIWEHLFAILNGSWLSKETIRSITSADKLAYLIARYEILEEMQSAQRTKLKKLSEVRNSVVHTGRFVDSQSMELATLFVRVTEHLVVKTLGLKPFDVLGTMDKFKDFILEEQKGVSRARSHKG